MFVTRTFSLLLAAMVLSPALVAAQEPALGVDAGNAVVVDAVNTDRELPEFDSTSAFRLRLPDGATCPGDSANDDYRVQTFLVPADTDLSTLVYRNRSPDGNDLYRALRYTDGEVSTQEMTNQNPGPNQPALILNYPVPFTFAYYSEGSLPPGQWKIGIACTPVPGWNVEKFWDAEIVLEAAPEVEPGGLRIRTVDRPEGGAVGESESGSISPVLAILLGAALLAGAAVLLVKRTSRTRATTNSSTTALTTKEYQ